MAKTMMIVIQNGANINKKNMAKNKSKKRLKNEYILITILFLRSYEFLIKFVNMDLVSTVTSAYNDPGFIPEMARSIRTQAYP
jgi:hypothetical protein